MAAAALRLLARGLPGAGAPAPGALRGGWGRGGLGAAAGRPAGGPEGVQARGTTVLCVRKAGEVVIMADGQVRPGARRARAPAPPGLTTTGPPNPKPR